MFGSRDYRRPSLARRFRVGDAASGACLESSAADRE